MTGSLVGDGQARCPCTWRLATGCLQGLSVLAVGSALPCPNLSHFFNSYRFSSLKKSQLRKNKTELRMKHVQPGPLQAQTLVLCRPARTAGALCRGSQPQEQVQARFPAHSERSWGYLYMYICIRVCTRALRALGGDRGEAEVESV